jgi:hypothetical protein
MSPAAPVVGRNVSFRLEGLEPWEEIGVTFIDPDGLAAAWIAPQDVNILGSDGKLLSTVGVFSDDRGIASWTRYGNLDVEGSWSVRVVLGGTPRSTTYSLEQLKLEGLEKFTLGTPLSGYRGSHSDIFYSEFVPASLAVDLQSHLEFAADFLAERTGARSEQAPELYLLGNRGLLDLISQATQVNLGFESGYYRKFGIKPGIYIQANVAETELQATLTHEYVHLVMDDVADGKRLPAWLTEGLAGYYEFEAGLAGDRPEAATLRLYQSTDLARAAAQDGSLLPLPSLESQAEWNGRSNLTEITLQYAEAQMAVRYISETYGSESAVDIVTGIGSGDDVATALEDSLGIPYTDFDSAFALWLKDWEDPERSASVEYFGTLDGMLAAASVLLERRRAELQALDGQFSTVESSAPLAEDAQALAAQIRETTPPASLQEIHQDAVSYFDVIAEWLNLELEYAQNRVDAVRVEANALIPEGSVREILLRQNIDDIKFVLNVLD